jgi:hypothetical protein
MCLIFLPLLMAVSLGFLARTELRMGRLQDTVKHFAAGSAITNRPDEVFA